MRIRKVALDILVLATSALPCVIAGSKFDLPMYNLNFKKRGSLSQKILVIPVRFSDHRYIIQRRSWEFDYVLNAKTHHAHYTPTGCVSEYIAETTYDQVHIDFVVHDWVDIPMTEDQGWNYESLPKERAGMRGAVHNALTQLDEAKYDFSQLLSNSTGFKQVLLIHSGRAGEHSGIDCRGKKQVDRIRSHAYHLGDDPWVGQINKHAKFDKFAVASAWYGPCGDNLARIAVIAHEVIHLFGMPDTYDVDKSPGKGLGKYDLLGNAWGYRSDMRYPPTIGIFSKILAGLVHPRKVNKNGSFRLGASNKHKDAIIIRKGMNKGEYLLIENRQPTGRDEEMPGGGLLIFHIDENRPHQMSEGYPNMPKKSNENHWPWNDKHYRIALLQADGKYDLERGVNTGDAGDFFRKGWLEKIGPDYPQLHLEEYRYGPYPNTDTYSFEVKRSNIVIYQVSESKEYMEFKVSFNNGYENEDCPYNRKNGMSRRCKKAKTSPYTVCKMMTDWKGKRVVTWKACRKECGMCQAEQYPPFIGTCKDDVIYRHWNNPTQDCSTIVKKNLCKDYATGYIPGIRIQKVKDYCKLSCDNCDAW